MTASGIRHTDESYLYESNGLGPMMRTSMAFGQALESIPAPVKARMTYLEERDTQDREDGTPRLSRLRQVPAEVGRFIAEMLLEAPEGAYIEIGTSAGYSTLWLALAARRKGGKIVTFEVLEEKVKLARDTFRLAGVEGSVELVAGDAAHYIHDYANIAFCFLDAEKEVYDECYDLVVSRLVSGGVLVADNAINHAKTLQPVIDKALADPRVKAGVVPIGKGELVCRRV